MTLPPEDNPIWARLEDDAAAERGAPLFNYGRLRGPAHAQERRSYFKSLVADHRKPFAPRLLILCGGCWLVLIGLFLYLGNRPFSGLLWALAGPPIGILTVFLAFEHPRRRKFFRAVARHAESLAKADSSELT